MGKGTENSRNKRKGICAIKDIKLKFEIKLRYNIRFAELYLRISVSAVNAEIRAPESIMPQAWYYTPGSRTADKKANLFPGIFYSIGIFSKFPIK